VYSLTWVEGASPEPLLEDGVNGSLAGGTHVHQQVPATAAGQPSQQKGGQFESEMG